ncbi:uncharacterized protein LOC119077910 [Bradysia coprophila]|uniref:uncharacterized protein LOC119077910 n=1 Tax=Bradysia coprophila TaxID=38358 RepID=UPI00187DBB4A|nr:uncharacterized protein LOC119077910 [Bradysia coprophila]
MSSSKMLNEQPPPYDQATTIDIDNASAPLLRETFSGSIFGTSTIVTFELAHGSRPKHIATSSECYFFDKACDYSFVIRDFLECVQASGNVANTSEDLHTTLLDVSGTEILQFRKRVDDFIDPPAVSPSAISNFLDIIFDKKRAKTNHTFEVLKNGQPLGLVIYGDKEPPETCLRIYIGGSELVIKSASLGEFIIFRDQSSASPLCHLNIEPDEFTGKIVFHPETGITADEQLLCTAAAFAFETCRTKDDIIVSRDAVIQMGFWMVFTLSVTIIVSGLLIWLVPRLM